MLYQLLALGVSASLADIETTIGGFIKSHTEEAYWEAWTAFHEMEDVIKRTAGYVTKEEHDHRFSIFKDNMEKIKKHNSNKNNTWWMGITQFADMTAEEFGLHIHKGCYHGAKKTTSPNPFTAKDAKNGTAPDAVDWTSKGAVTPVKNQGSCGSCWAFSTTGAIEGRCQISTGTLTSLSEQDLVDCSKANNGCNGGLMDNAFAYVKKKGGICTEQEYAYKAKNELICHERWCATKAGKITGYKDVTPNSEKDLMAAVAEGPVSIAIEADQQTFQLYKGGVFKGTCGDELDHGVLAVGYGEDGGDKYWKVKNSWGASWGEEGYIRMIRGVGTDDGEGQCGILKQPSYPIC